MDCSQGLTCENSSKSLYQASLLADNERTKIINSSTCKGGLIWSDPGMRYVGHFLFSSGAMATFTLETGRQYTSCHCVGLNQPKSLAQEG